MQDLNKNLLRYHQREEMKAEIERADAMLAGISKAGDDKGAIISSRNRTKKALEQQSPVPLTAKEKDKLFDLEKKLRNKISQGMPTEEHMRKNPPGAVDHHVKWQNANKKLIRMWKNVQIQLNPDSSDRDLANIERFRPSGQTDRMRTDAQIPGLMTYGNISDEQWPFETPQTTALAQVQKREYDDSQAEQDVDVALAEVEVAEDELKTEEKPKLSPEQYAEKSQNLAKAREVLKAKREADKKLQEQLQAEPVNTDSLASV